MAVYIGHDECQVIYVARNGQQLRVSSIWVGDQQVFPPANRQEVHVFTRDTQGYSRYDHGTFFEFTVPVPWWATSMDAVILGAVGDNRLEVYAGDAVGERDVSGNIGIDCHRNDSLEGDRIGSYLVERNVSR